MTLPVKNIEMQECTAPFQLLQSFFIATFLVELHNIGYIHSASLYDNDDGTLTLIVENVKNNNGKE